MARRIPQNLIDEIVERTDIVALISERTPLKKAGREWRGLCPFHGEKSPSFYVNAEKGVYNCFGCGAKGNALGFLEQLDNLSFPEAIEQLAQRAGITIEKEYLADSGQHAAQSDPQYELLDRACAFFQRLLVEDTDAAAARAYAERRGLVGETAETFAIGWAPSGWTRLCQRLQSAGISPREALDVGLAQKREENGPLQWSNMRDKFVDRLMFPIHDRRGRVIGFGGRALRDDQQPKYLNSPTTALFHKGRVLYNLHRARRDISEGAGVLIVEGYMDLIAFHRAGVHNVVATLGTALTSEHARLLRRYTRRILLSFDSDAAGKQAAFRSLEVLLPEGIDPRGVILTDGKDPDEVLTSHGPEVLKAQLEKSISVLDAFLDEQISGARSGELTEQRRVISKVAPVLGRSDSPAQRDAAVRRLAMGLGLSEEAIRAELRRAFRNARSGAPSQEAAPAGRVAPPPPPPPAETLLLTLYIHIGWVRTRTAAEDLSSHFTNEVLRSVYEVARTLETSENDEHFPAKLLAHLEAQEVNETLLNMANEIAGRPPVFDEENGANVAFDNTMRQLRLRDLRTEKQRLQSQLKEITGTGQDDLRADLSRRLLDVERQLRQ